MSVKEGVLSALDSLPDNATFDEAIYHLYIHRKIEIGLAQAERGALISDEDLAKQLDQWDAADHAPNRMVHPES
jgi:predicted transcriptional regulator